MAGKSCPSLQRRSPSSRQPSTRIGSTNSRGGGSVPKPAEELRRRIVAELNAGVPGAKLGLERELGGSIYEILETHYGLVTSRADERIEAVNATPEESTLLGIKQRSALLLITRIAYDHHGAPYEFSRDLFRGDRTLLAVTVQ